MLLSVSPKSTLSRMQPSQPDTAITTTTSGYCLSRVMGKGQVGGSTPSHTHTHTGIKMPKSKKSSSWEGSHTLQARKFSSWSEARLWTSKCGSYWREHSTGTSLSLLLPGCWKIVSYTDICCTIAQRIQVMPCLTILKCWCHSHAPKKNKIKQTQLYINSLLPTDTSSRRMWWWSIILQIISKE